MVKKLIKYDLKAFLKVMLPVYFVLIGVAALYRIVSLFENDGVFFGIFNASAVIILVISVIVCLLLTFIFSIVRFYKNLYTAEGYLTFTLPVTPAAHIISKLTVSLIFDVITLAVVILSVAVATAGELFAEIVKAAFYLLGGAFRFLGGQSPLYVAEFVIMIIASLVAAHLLTYMCISVGQVVNKHKILLAVGVYFGVYVVSQVIGTVVLALGVSTDLPTHIAEFAYRSPHAFLHILLCGVTLLEIALAAIYYAVTHRMIKKHLNLE